MPEGREQKMSLLILETEKARRSYERSYCEFFRAAWEVLEPNTPLRFNWHIKYLCDLLQAEIERIAAREPKTEDIVINISPRSAKSYIVSIMWHPWAWTRFPHLKFISSSHAEELSVEHCRKSRQLIESAWYQERWGHVFSLTGDQNVKSFYENDKFGARHATSVGGSITGHGADVIISDDPLNPKKVASESAIVAANKHYDDELYTRLNDQEVGVRVLIMQRLHEDDTTGHVLRKWPGKYVHINIPAECDAGSVEVSPPELKKFYVGGLFFPDRFSKAILGDMKANGHRFYVGQFLQAPAEKEGNLLKRGWWKYYRELPDRFDVMIQSWDCSFKDLETSSYVVGQVWGKKGIYYYLINQMRGLMNIKATIRAIFILTQKYPQATKKLIEDKANGTAVIQLLQGEVSGIWPVEPKGGKYSRASAVSYLAECGLVHLPDPAVYPWVNAFVDECAAFPKGSDNDQVDAMSQALSELNTDDPAERLKRLLGDLAT